MRLKNFDHFLTYQNRKVPINWFCFFKRFLFNNVFTECISENFKGSALSKRSKTYLSIYNTHRFFFSLISQSGCILLIDEEAFCIQKGNQNNSYPFALQYLESV